MNDMMAGRLPAERQEFVDAVNRAALAALGDSNDEEIEALTEAVEIAKGLLSAADLIPPSHYLDPEYER